MFDFVFDMRSRYLLILLIVIVSLLPAWLFNRYMQAVIQPRQSFAQLLLYMLVMAAFVAGYTFLVVWLIMQIFPVAVK
jgi:hypothetical protein